MKRFITFGSIDKFDTVVKNIKRTATYAGQDENDEAIYKEAVLPKVVATASEKIHGTNASVCFSNPDGFWTQSRKNIITTDKDNAGCAFFVDNTKDEWMEIILKLADEHSIDLDENIISVYFEWSGGNIQKKSACTGVDKRAIIFRHFKVSPIEPQMGNDGAEGPKSAEWLEAKVKLPINTQEEFDDAWVYDKHKFIYVSNEDKNIFNIMTFPTISLEIDFNRPDLANNEMIKMVETIEAESLVGKAFGQDKNIGEGYVVTFEFNGAINRFKIKGDKHSKGSVKVKTLKTLKPVDSVKEQKKIDFVTDFACTEGRLEQMWTEIVHSVHNGDEQLMTRKNMGSFLSLVAKDVVKEEGTRLHELGLEPKEVNGKISEVARNFFDSKLAEIIGI